MFLSRQQLADFGERLDKHRVQLLKERYIPQIKAFPEVRALFERILADSKQIALASSAKEDELAKYKQIANIDDLVDAETSSDDAENSEPHPDIFEVALKRPDDPRSMHRYRGHSFTMPRLRGSRTAHDWGPNGRLDGATIETSRLCGRVSGRG